jgi:hypothetical protein
MDVEAMTIKDSMHQANAELTAEFAGDLLTQTSKDIEAHSAESWELARTHAAAMIRSGWDRESASIAAAEQYGVTPRPLQLLFALDAEVFG